MVANRPNGALYVGVTDDLTRRIWQHRGGLIDGFTKRYGLKRLVHFSVTTAFEPPGSASKI